MRISAVSSIFLLTACILSYGVTGAFAAEGNQQVPLSVETNYPAYSDGTELVIFGQVRDSSIANQPTPIIIRIVSADGASIVGLAQVNLDSDNGYSYSMTAGGPLWKTNGEYTIKAQYGAQKGETTFTFTGGVIPSSTPEPVVVEEPVVVVEPVVVPNAIFSGSKGSTLTVPSPVTAPKVTVTPNPSEINEGLSESTDFTIGSIKIPGVNKSPGAK